MTYKSYITIPIFNGKKCPCADCLLKGNCSDMCEARREYRDAYNVN